MALIAAFAVPAELCILDEPTSGLDPLMEVVFQHGIARVRRTGPTVLLPSHILPGVEQLCERVSIIRSGRVVETGTLAQLRHLTRSEVSFAAEGPRVEPPSLEELFLRHYGDEHAEPAEPAVPEVSGATGRRAAP